ncbi:winged helix-turn-helix domain-containing protein [Ectopseudomonas oleovorans]|uniref:Putative ATPase n=1 Tax=Ectopseudomonas oleovorans TaxID=301 RepID=A0A3D9EBH1_ECTOL|nr:winged helix-turn-helix domain-containing protein [Pseudomonas oleovorans]RED00348.1 putative ATPase [Pseudomonas oleovorans]
MNSIFHAKQPSARPSSLVDTFRFGCFSLHRKQRLLLRNEVPIVVGSRALDLLIAFAERPGEVLEKAELIACAWPKLVVEECNLRAQIAALRRALREDDGAEYIVNIPGRGYCFTASATGGEEEVQTDSHDLQTGRLPSLVTAPLGRTQILDRLDEQLAPGSLLSLVGPVGIGKSTLAVALANEVGRRISDGVCYLDLARVEPEEGLAHALAQVLNLPATVDFDSIVQHLSNRNLLLVLDNCDPLLEPAAMFVDHLTHWAPGCTVIATSREPLRTRGERVERLLPLPVPPRDVGCLEEALGYHSLQLLIERVRAQDLLYEIKPEDLRAAVAICRSMDGVPLDIEIAANRMLAFGMQQVAILVKTDYRLEMKGLRTAAPRHRSMRAALSLAYAALDEDEQRMLQLLSVFDGSFTLDAARSVIADEFGFAQQLLPLIDSLVEKSMLIVQSDSTKRLYRLLHSQRIFSRELLEQTGLMATLQSRRAAFAMDVVRLTASHMQQVAPELWQRVYGAESDTVRSALTWACSVQGDPAVGHELSHAVLGLPVPRERDSHPPHLTVAAARAR